MWHFSPTMVHLKYSLWTIPKAKTNVLWSAFSLRICSNVSWTLEPHSALSLEKRTPKGNYGKNMAKTFKDGFVIKLPNHLHWFASQVMYGRECSFGCFRVRAAEHAIQTWNFNYPMAKYYRKGQHGSDATLKESGIKVIRSEANKDRHQIPWSKWQV